MSLQEQAKKLSDALQMRQFIKEGAFYVSSIPASELKTPIFELAKDFGINPNRNCGIPNHPPADDHRVGKYQQSFVVLTDGRLSIHEKLYHELIQTSQNPPPADKNLVLDGSLIKHIFRLDEPQDKRLLPSKKAAIVAGIFNTGLPAKFDVVLKNGTVEVKDATLNTNEMAVIQPGGEINRPAHPKTGVNTFEKLYDTGSPIADEAEAEHIATARGIAFPDHSAIDRAMDQLRKSNPGADLSQFKIAFYEAKGAGNIVRLPQIYADIELPQPTWGEGQKQNNRGGDLLMLNKDGSVYMIGKDEFLNTYVNPERPSQSKAELYDSIPIIGSDMIECAIPQINAGMGSSTYVAL